MVYFNRILLAGLLAFCLLKCNSKGADTDLSTNESYKMSVLDIEEEIFNLLMDWLKSQNDGDFNRYRTFYSDDFHGIKRAGENEYSFKKDDWLVDRKKMFERKMVVRATDIQIVLKDTLHKITFNQDWQSTNFRDYGSKVLLVSQDKNKLLIVGEEMLESKLAGIRGDANNALNHINFFRRAGAKLLLAKELNPGNLIKTRTKCVDGNEEHKLCVQVHDYEIEKGDLEALDIAKLNMRVVLGNIKSETISYGITKEYRMVNEELLDSLPGISFDPTIFQTTYSWKGGRSKLSEFYSVLYCEADTVVRPGQWAFISEVDPIIFTKSVIEDSDLKANYYTQIERESNEENYGNENIILFEDGLRFYLVSYYSGTECGDTYYENIQLWERIGDEYHIQKELPDVPGLIFDLDRDGDIDIIYEGEFDDDPDDYLDWVAPYYYLNGVDTVFAGCGC
ncbi:MAG: hypothetical protein ABJH04_06760 [Cyclobacteriaceae bacterium]